jgi:hypothetical protein
MPRATFAGVYLGDSTDAGRTLLDRPDVSEGGLVEVVEHVAGLSVLPIDRGNQSVTLGFRVAHTYGTTAAAEAAVLEWANELPRAGTLEWVTTGGETITLRMECVRQPVKGVPRGILVEWAYQFIGPGFVRVATPETPPDYDGGEADSGDVFTRFFWGGVAGDGAGSGAAWSRELNGGTA